MPRYLQDPVPENLGQFLGQQLTGTVVPFLQDERKRRYLMDVAAQKRQDLLGERDSTAAYRSSMLSRNAATLAETNRHNLAMEGKQGASKEYNPNDLEEAITHLTLHPDQDPTGKIRNELVALHGRISKSKAPVDPNEPSSFPQVRQTAQDFKTSKLAGFASRIAPALVDASNKDSSMMYDASSYGSHPSSEDLIGAGNLYRNYLSPDVRSTVDSGLVALGTPSMDLARKWGYLGQGLGGNSMADPSDAWGRATFEDWDSASPDAKQAAIQKAKAKGLIR